MVRNRERRRFKEIQRQLSNDDPEFARRMTTPRLVARLGRWITAWRLLGLLAATSAVLCLVLGEAGSFLLASALALVLLGYARWRPSGESLHSGA
ncbi:hypothetical protein GCM10009854_17730 [Saccharopolyspora halophila]|uniref:DUF3040 domain-containing protein n=1 Tax=Saccharopolyspora halophila TaxID=405551 RepID=A0ABN3G0K0_9PSEU